MLVQLIDASDGLPIYVAPDRILVIKCTKTLTQIRLSDAQGAYQVNVRDPDGRVAHELNEARERLALQVAMKIATGEFLDTFEKRIAIQVRELVGKDLKADVRQTTEDHLSDLAGNGPKKKRKAES